MPDLIDYRSATKEEWAEILITLWKENRSKPRWTDLYELHDKEDQQYFDMLNSKFGQ